jgi:hypothetical protein
MLGQQVPHLPDDSCSFVCLSPQARLQVLQHSNTRLPYEPGISPVNWAVHRLASTHRSRGTFAICARMHNAYEHFASVSGRTAQFQLWYSMGVDTGRVC